MSPAAALRAPAGEAVERVTQLVDERRRLDRDLTEARKKLAMGGGNAGSADSDIAEVGGVKLMARVLTGIDARDLKTLADDGKKRLGSGIVALVAVSEDGKAGLVVAVTDDLKGRISAVDLVRKGAEPLGGKGGGGRADMAQAGGPNGADAQGALDAISKALKEM